MKGFGGFGGFLAAGPTFNAKLPPLTHRAHHSVARMISTEHLTGAKRGASSLLIKATAWWSVLFTEVRLL